MTIKPKHPCLFNCVMSWLLMGADNVLAGCMVHFVECGCKMKSHPPNGNVSVKQINIHCSIKKASKPRCIKHVVYKNRSMLLFAIRISWCLKRGGSKRLLTMYVNQQKDYSWSFFKSLRETCHEFYILRNKSWFLLALHSDPALGIKISVLTHWLKQKF